MSAIPSDPLIQCLLLSWNLGDDETHTPSRRVRDAQRVRSATVLTFLLASRTSAATSP
ncbi:hypothetical protein H3V53_05170 [Paraburkholderia bengalensis]|uniref:Uncharacterized protein n=1 Tax=Paraburkholderia bengalensis TaxID=2747562 RepID=A0ABU8IM89_9BURK